MATVEVPGGTLRRVASVTALLCAVTTGVAGCGTHSESLAKVRSALDAGQMRTAVKLLNEELDVKSDTELPEKLDSDKALYLLDRATVQQSLVQFAPSKRDFQEADKAIDLLDLSRNAADEIGKYMFSDSAGAYKAPAYEKLLLNTFNMVNYLETRDLNGAKVEARKLAVYINYYRDKLKKDSPALGLAGFLAGYAFEKSGSASEAMGYYDDALAFGSYPALATSVRALAPKVGFKSTRVQKVVADGGEAAPAEGGGEIVTVIGYGRVPHKIPNRVPIGLALTYASVFLRAADVAAANQMAAQGLVTWVNYPSLAKGNDALETPSLTVDGQAEQLSLAVDVTSQVRAEWKEIEGGIMAAAILRMIVRTATGLGIQAATSGGSEEVKVAGIIASLFTQATLTALDKPDTRSWETLPARVAVARTRVPAGRHVVTLRARGMTRTQTVDVGEGGWSVVSLMALR